MYLETPSFKMGSDSVILNFCTVRHFLFGFSTIILPHVLVQTCLVLVGELE